MLQFAVALLDDFLYASSPTQVLRWAFDPDADPKDLGAPTTVITVRLHNLFPLAKLNASLTRTFLAAGTRRAR